MARLLLALLLIGAAASATASAHTASERSFGIANDRFVLDGKEVQIISGRCDGEATYVGD